MGTSKDYNYKRFGTKYYALHDFQAPKAGERAVDFEAEKLDGSRVRLSEYFGKPIVLETGSRTCPMYCNNIGQMNELARRYPEVQFLVLYVREAHPGEKTSAHASIGDKRKAASALVLDDNENREILIDDLQGSAHRSYGTFPNSIFVINPEGFIQLSGDWNDYEIIKGILDNYSPDYKNDRIHYEPPKPISIKAVTVLLRGGFLALYDFVISLPSLMLAHRKANRTHGSSKT